jgi:CheY-like chemotaxis protein
VIADIRIGTSDGYDLLKAIRKTNVEYKGFTPVIAVTGFASPEDEERALNAGFDAYFPKPFDPEDLVNATEKMLSQPRNLAA